MSHLWTRSLLAAVVCVTAAASAGCSSSSSDKDSNPEDGGASSGGTASGACSYAYFGVECELWTNVTPGALAADQLECENSFAGTAQTSCPTIGVIGTCTVPPANPASDSTDQIFYYSSDGGYAVLTPADSCANDNHGTYTPAP